MTSILGISAFYHDSAATLIINGEVVAAAQEERFTRIKHDSKYPYHAVEFVLKYANLELKNIDFIVYYEKPFLKFERLLETYIAFAPLGFISFCKAMPLWVKEKLFQKKILFNELKRHDNNFNDLSKLKFSEHHLSHAASAFFPSTFDKAIVLTADGVGEWATTSVCIARDNNIEIVKEIFFPHSIGLIYSAFTYFCGFKVNSGEYKLMGLAPYGEPIYYEVIVENLIHIKKDGSFRLNQKYFSYATGLTMTNKNFNKLFGCKPRNAGTENIKKFHMDLAASIQKVIEEVILKICKSLKSEYKINNLCLAGGVALNCVANNKIIESNIFENVWIQPAAGDAGGSLGAALSYWHLALKKKRKINPGDSMKGSYLGPEYKQKEIESILSNLGAIFIVIPEDKIINLTADSLSNDEVIGWFQGRMEFGPRALGNRSILANSQSSGMQRKLNLKVKFRESFRPFAPSVLNEDAKEWFKIKESSPYMLLALPVNDKKVIRMSHSEESLFGIEKLNISRSSIPAVTHVDYTARVQTVDGINNPIYYKLLKRFKKITGCSVLVNTSFNVRGEPIVNSPKDAYRCFMGTGMDKLVIGNCMLEKKDQPEHLKENYKELFDSD